MVLILVVAGIFLSLFDWRQVTPFLVGESFIFRFSDVWERDKRVYWMIPSQVEREITAGRNVPKWIHKFPTVPEKASRQQSDQGREKRKNNIYILLWKTNQVSWIRINIQGLARKSETGEWKWGNFPRVDCREYVQRLLLNVEGKRENDVDFLFFFSLLLQVSGALKIRNRLRNSRAAQFSPTCW